MGVTGMCLSDRAGLPWWPEEFERRGRRLLHLWVKQGRAITGGPLRAGLRRREPSAEVRQPT